MEILLKAVYGAFCTAGIAIDAYSCVCYVLRHRRPAPSAVPLLGLILYVLAANLRAFTDIGPLFVQWELLVLVGFHALCHLVIPTADRLILRPKKRLPGEES
jgi:hypothetical protein